MDKSFLDLVYEAWRAVGLVVVPTLVIAAVGGIVALLQGFLGVRDEAFTYAARIAVVVALGAAFAGTVGDAFVRLMAMALQ